MGKVSELWHGLTESPDDFLSRIDGVIHVGANTGQERRLYRRFGLAVLWIEPIPAVFAELGENISGFEGQKAVQALVTDKDGVQHDFHVANNAGASSSILRMKHHADIWPDVQYTSTIPMTSVRLDTLLRREDLDISQYQALVLDTQGSELLVLQGSGDLLGGIRFIKIEVPDFEAYEGCCQLAQVTAFMEANGFQEHVRTEFASRDAGGSYFDVIYHRRPKPLP